MIRGRVDGRQLALPFSGMRRRMPPIFTGILTGEPGDPKAQARCGHRLCFTTHACVPPGICCAHCGMLVSQYIPQPPEVVGYLTATWAWKHVHGNEWTTF